MLLLAVQQSAGSMTAAIFDQFLRRRHNQIYFGFFIGLALNALVTLATVRELFNPVFGATLVFILTVVALLLLLMLMYTTINQMRPVEIIEAIHDRILDARKRQQRLLCQTRRQPSRDGAVNAPVSAPVQVRRRGFVTHIDMEALGAAVNEAQTRAQGDIEVILQVSIGSYVAFQDVIAEVHATTQEQAGRMVSAVHDAIHLERQRDIDNDPAYGIEQLETIVWTSISSSKSNPEPGLLTIHSLRDVMAHWSADANEECEANEEDEATNGQPIPVVYTDKVFARLTDAFETLAIASTESMQHQNFTEVVRTFAMMFDRLPPAVQPRAEDLILRILSALGDHVLTAELDAALTALIGKLTAFKRMKTAEAVRAARDRLVLSVGKLHSRSDRATAG